MPRTFKKPRIIFLTDKAFSNSPKRLANRLNITEPTKKFLVRLKSRPPILQTPKRKILVWGQNINKHQQYQTFKDKEIPHPEWTTDINVAEQWHRDGHTVLARTLLNSYGGKGIIVFDENNPFNRNINCRVWTKYKKKKHEYRLHVFDGTVIDFAQKKKKRENNNNNTINHQIRNHKNGWIYSRENVQLHPSITPLAINALKALNLTYGAVDIIWNEKENQAYLLEVNTSPGLEGTTIESYANAFKTYLNK